MQLWKNCTFQDSLSSMLFWFIMAHQGHFCMGLRNWEFGSSHGPFYAQKVAEGQQGTGTACTDDAVLMADWVCRTAEPVAPELPRGASCTFLSHLSQVHVELCDEFTTFSCMPPGSSKLEEWEANAGSSSSIGVPFCPHSLSQFTPILPPKQPPPDFRPRTRYKHNTLALKT